MLIASLLVVVASITVTGFNPELAETYEISVLFDNVSGLKTGAPVLVAGIKIGSVDRIDLDGDKARLFLKLFAKYKIFNDSQAQIKSVGILGDKYVEIQRGSPLQSPLQQGDEIKRLVKGNDLDSLVEELGTTLRDIQSVTSAMRKTMGGEEGERRFNAILGNLEELTSSVNDIARVTNSRINSITLQLDSFTADLAQITRNNKENIQDIVANIQTFSQDLQQITTANRENLQDLIANLRNFSTALSDDGPRITGDLKGILSENRENLRKGIASFDQSLSKLDDSMKNIQSITRKVDDGQGTIGKLVNDEQTVDKLNEAVGKLNKLLGGAERIKLDISVHGEYLRNNQSNFGDDAHTKGYLSVQLQPLKDRFYTMQLISNPRGKKVRTNEITFRSVNDSKEDKVTEQQIEVKDEMQLSAAVNQRYYDTVFRLGLFENKFGVGVQQIIGRNEQFSLNFEGWDFGGDLGTHLKTYGVWKFHSNLFASAGLDDYINKNSRFRDRFIGFGITFNEDVLKPYLGSLPLGAIK